MGAAHCSQCDTNSGSLVEVVYDPDHGTGEGTLRIDTVEDEGEDPEVAERLDSRGRRGPTSPSAVLGLHGPEDKRKASLKIRSFVAEAAEGQSCGLLDMKLGVVEDAEFTIDSQIRTFTVRKVETAINCGCSPRVGAEGPLGYHSFEIGRIVDLLLEEDLPPSLHASLQQVTDENNRGLLVLIKYSTDKPNKPNGSVALIMDDSEARMQFMACMNILQLHSYAQHSVENSATHLKMQW